MSETKEVPETLVPRWRAVLIAVVATLLLCFVVWLILGRSEKHDVLRWSKGGDLEETDAFLKAVNHSNKDQNHWLSDPGSLGVALDARQLDYTLPHVAIYSVPNIHPPHGQPTLRELGDTAQARAIDAIERAKGPNDNPWNNLKKALSDEDEPGARDPFLFDRVLVATVTKGVKWPPGDRMVWTRAFVTPINFKFSAYTIASTENETVKVSSVEATDEHKLSAGAELAIPGIKDAKLELKPESGSTVKTDFDVNSQYERLGVDIMPTFLRIIRESGAGGDVIGNTKIALSMTTDPETIKAGNAGVTFGDPEIDLVVTGLDLKDGLQDPTMNVLPIVPLPHCALRADIWAVYEQRHIQEGGKFYDESQQRVVFIHDVDQHRTVEIMGADDVSPFIWTIQLVPDGKNPDDRWDHRVALNAKYAKGNGDKGSWRPLVFSDYGRAAELAHWVRTHEGKQVSDYEFNWKGSGGLAVIKHSTDDCVETPGKPLPQKD